MEDKTIIIHPAIEVPEGDDCTHCDRLSWGDGHNGYKYTWCSLFKETITEFEKCLKCKDICTKKNKPCETCKGEKQIVESTGMLTKGETVHTYMIPCPKCQPTTGT